MPGDYETGTQRSKELFERAKRVFAGGVNHNARFYNPYPIFAERAKAQHLWDADGRRYVDYWMGHMALVLGHSPSVVVEELAAQAGRGTLFGTGSRLAVELGEEIQDAVACAEKLRFCNTGAEATMYLVRLARGFTGKKTVVKMAGGWHGYNTELNKGVHQPFDASESSGILRGEQEHVKTVKFNDIEAARLAVKGSQGDVAAILLEPVLGAGGCIPADRDYLRGLRELADSAGALLAFDEIVTGFRVAFGGAMEHYAVTPDLATFGKVVGGGLPLGLVCGRKEVIDLADPSRTGNFVSIGGGTFSENPMTMVAGLATIRHLKKMKSKIYPTLAEEGEGVRLGVDRAFAERGIETHSTGLGSLFLTHFGLEPKNAEDAAKESKSTLHDYGIHMMTRGVFFLPGHPCAISTEHSPVDLDDFVKKSGLYADELAKGKKMGVRRSRRPSTTSSQRRTS